MKKITLLFSILLASITMSAQIVFDHDTVYNELVLGVKTDVKVWIRNGGTPIEAKYRIYYDDVKTQSDWDVQFCDCEDCKTNYPAVGSCDPIVAGLLSGENPHSYILYVKSNSVIDDRELHLIVMGVTDTTIRDTVVFKTRLATSVQEREIVNQSLRISPNPAHHQANLSLETPQNSGVEVELTNLLGETVKTFELPETSGPMNMTMELDGLNSGLYLVRVHLDDFTLTRRLQVR